MWASKIKIKFEYDWDWGIFATPCIEIGNIVGYPFVMVRIGWLWFAMELKKYNPKAVEEKI